MREEKYKTVIRKLILKNKQLRNQIKEEVNIFKTLLGNYSTDNSVYTNEDVENMLEAINNYQSLKQENEELKRRLSNVSKT